MHLSCEAATRVVHVSASPEHWPYDSPMLSILAMIPVTGEWPESVDIRCSASDGDQPLVNWP